MGIAQKLYESGYITYMRTDSTNLGQQALGQIAGVIEKEYGKEYLQFRTYSAKAKMPRRRTRPSVLLISISSMPDTMMNRKSFTVSYGNAL